MSQLICDLCFPKSEEIGLISSDIALMFKDNKYYLVWGQGHKDDAIYYCSEKPLVDPDPNCESDDDLGNNWMITAETAYDNLKMHPDSGYAFFKSCEEGGYKRESPHKLLCHWLYNKCGELLKKTL